MPYTPLDQTRVLWDEQGKPYWASTDGRSRHYIPPIVAGQYRDDPRMLAWAASQGVTEDDPNGNVPGGGFLRGRGQWDSEQGKYTQPINGGNLLSAAVGAMIGAPWIAGAMGGGAAAAPSASASGAAGGVIPSSSIPTSALMGGPSAASAGLTAGAGAGGAAGAANALANGGSALANGGGLLNKILDWAPVGAAAFGAGRQLLQGPPDAQQNLERILKMAEGRVNASQPVFDQLNTFVQSRMPNYVKGQ
jgi:hypothetical protein